MNFKIYLSQKGKKTGLLILFAAAAIVILIMVVSIGYLFVPAFHNFTQQLFFGKGEGQRGEVSRAVKYTCAMHPFVIADRPSACPICGMTLVAQENPAPQKDIACAVHAPGAVTLTQQQRAMANVAVVKVALREFSAETVAPGKVAWDERRLSRVSSRIQGRVERLHVNFTGSRVRAGQPLMDIYSPDLVSAQREYLLAIEGSERAKESPLPESRSMMEGLRDASAMRLKGWGMSDRQIADLERSRQPKRVVTIHAPVAGIVTERLVTAGQYVNEGAALFSIGSLSTLWVFAELYENDLGRAEASSAALVTTEAYPGKVFQGKVTFVDPVINPETRTLKVRIDLDNRLGLLKPEMFVKVRLKGRKIKELAIPEGAVIFSGECSMVWVESPPGVYLPRNITVGRKGDGYYEVISGLSGGESVAASGGFLIDAESQLKALQSTVPGEGKQR